MPSKKRILAVDDEVGPRESLRVIFSDRYEVLTAGSAEEALSLLSNHAVDLILLDVIMPGKDGIELLEEARGLYPNMPAIMISASTDVRPVVRAMRMGAFDYVSKPFDVEELLQLAERAIEGGALSRRVETLESELAREFPVGSVVGQSKGFLRALNDLRTAASTDATVLIQGESGTGKELAARMLHSLGDRAGEPFVPVHCAALSETLMESELFGHEKGAFTSADRRKPGRFDLAGSGTLFFDEVSEMSAATQVKLLRVLQEKEFMRVGGTQVIRTNARIVAATARDLRDEAEAGRFRHDLYFRLGVVPVHLPPLREREGDIPLLVGHFVRYFRRSLDVAAEGFDSAAMDRLCEYSWPGNVRELRNIVERMLVLHGRESRIREGHLPPEFRGSSSAASRTTRSGSLQEMVASYESEIIRDALKKTGGVQTRAAELLGTTRRILGYRIEKLGIDPQDAAEPAATGS